MQGVTTTASSSRPAPAAMPMAAVSHTAAAVVSPRIAPLRVMMSRRRGGADNGLGAQAGTLSPHLAFQPNDRGKSECEQQLTDLAPAGPWLAATASTHITAPILPVRDTPCTPASYFTPMSCGPDRRFADARDQGRGVAEGCTGHQLVLLDTDRRRRLHRALLVHHHFLRVPTDDSPWPSSPRQPTPTCL